jgi:hypothetical protein
MVCGMTEQLAEKVLILSELGRKHPSGAKAHIDLIAFAARLKPCPFKTSPLGEFFSKL